MRNLLPLVFLAACAHGSPYLQYEPEVSTIQGRLVIERYRQPPVGGITGDGFEVVYLVELAAPVDVRVARGGEPPYDDHAGLRFIQVIPPAGEDLADREGEQVSVTGTLFPAETSAHHTPVCMRAEKVGR